MHFITGIELAPSAPLAQAHQQQPHQHCQKQHHVSAFATLCSPSRTTTLLPPPFNRSLARAPCSPPRALSLFPLCRSLGQQFRCATHHHFEQTRQQRLLPRTCTDAQATHSVDHGFRAALHPREQHLDAVCIQNDGGLAVLTLCSAVRAAALCARRLAAHTSLLNCFDNSPAPTRPPRQHRFALQMTCTTSWALHAAQHPILAYSAAPNVLSKKPGGHEPMSRTVLSMLCIAQHPCAPAPESPCWAPLCPRRT
eukprot:634666-Rhodomonas_salina.1